MTALERVTARRIWFVPGVTVYGSATGAEFGVLLSEMINGQRAVYYQSILTGDDIQRIRFDSLTDHRGNRLPAEISVPRVIPRSRSEQPVFVTSIESNESFTIARPGTAQRPVTADLLIVELGA